MAKSKRKPSDRPAAEQRALRRLLSSPLRLALAASAFAAVIIAIAGAAALLAADGGGDNAPAPTKTAAIVDQLSLTQANPEFVSDARKLLGEAGYAVDYIPGEQVTVDFYRGLPQHDYDLVLLRVHAGITTEVDTSSGSETETEYVSLFTGEPYSADKYGDEQLNRLGQARYYEGADPLFGIGPRFIEESMQGEFDDTLIVMMGCDGLRSQRTAEAFLARGASAFVSWSQPVSADHTDTATKTLLENLLVKGLETTEAVERTATEVGPDPIYQGELRVITSKS
jgi:hypothetical protein